MYMLKNYAMGQWVEGTGRKADLFDAVTGDKIGESSSDGLDFKAMMHYARAVGGPKMRALTFHQRAAMLKAIAKVLMERKDDFYALSYLTGATKTDSWVDIEGGIGTFFAYSSRGRREFPNECFHVEGPTEPLSKNGTFVGRHILVPIEGVAVHINAFNFPVWGMLEKLAPALLAGVPCIVKPATAGSHLAEAVFRTIVETGILPDGALQLVCGSAGDMLDHLEEQDVVAFTGSAATGQKLKSGAAVVKNSVRFNMEADSLNCSILGPGVRMGPLASRSQVNAVRSAAEMIRHGAELVFGGGDFEVVGADREKGSFFAPMLMVCDQPLTRLEAHDVEAFGPVNTVMPYHSIEEAIQLARMGKGSLVGSLITADPTVARRVILGTAAFHGRMLVLDRTSAKESTGHGSPLPQLVHGGPGRAGGGEEMGGARGVTHYMQRVALQGSPSMITAITREWTKGASEHTDAVHPFRKTFDELEIGDTLITKSRTITLDDIEAFAHLSGDTFYAHMNDDDARSHGVFEGRVAHGYFIVSAAAGLFVEPALGPVLANYGMEKLRFTKPVYPGDTIHVRLTVKQKTAKDTPDGTIPQGVVEWDVEVMSQDNEAVAVYSILTLVRRSEPARVG